MSGEIYTNPSFSDELPPEISILHVSQNMPSTRCGRLYQDEDSSRQRDVSIQVEDIRPDARRNIVGVCRARDGGASVKELLHHYRESATIHGISTITGPHFYICRRPVWLVLVLVMACLLTMTLLNQLTMFAQRPIRTVSKVTLNSDLAFPAVTFCNLNQFIIDRVPDIPIVKEVLIQQSEYYETASGFTNYRPRLDLDNLTDVPGEELRRMLRHASPRLDDFLLQCRWQMRQYDCREIFKEMNTEFGVCFTFNSHHEEQKGELRRAGTSWSSLRVLVDTQNDRSYYSTFMHAGIKVVIHEPDETPYPMWHGLLLRPGVAAVIGLDRSDSFRLAAPYKAFHNGYCEDTQAEGYINPLRRYPVYSAENCLSECLMDQLEAHCGCLSYKAHGNYTVCSAKQMLNCEIPRSASINFRDLESCPCRRPCHSVTYNADVTYADFASIFIEEQAQRDNITILDKTLRQNTLDAKVYYKSLNVYEVKQEPKLTGVSVIGTVGGQMGLFLGASLLSVTELAEVLLLVAVRGIKRCASWITGKQAVTPTNCGI